MTNLYRDEILDEALLPIYHVAYTPCFRREQISAGRDVRGIKRGYQFDKVEMVKFVHPDRSAEEHRRLIEEAADTLRALELPYRRGAALHRRPRFRRRRQGRPGDLGAGLGGVAGGVVVRPLRRLPGAAGQHPLPPGGGRAPPLPAHPERLRPGPAADDDRHHGELSAADGTIEVPMVLRPYLGGQAVIGEQPPIGPASPAG